MLINVYKRRNFFALFSSFLFYITSKSNANADETINSFVLEEALKPRYLGLIEAPLQMIEFVSLTCGHCADFHLNTLPILKEKYIEKGLLRLEMRDFPLDGLALRASAMARLVPVNRYYKLIDILFKNQNNWTKSNPPLDELKKIGRLAGLTSIQIDIAMDNMNLLEGIFKMRQLADKEWNIQSTPSFIINNEIMLSGNLPIQKFEEAFSEYRS